MFIWFVYWWVSSSLIPLFISFFLFSSFCECESMSFFFCSYLFGITFTISLGVLFVHSFLPVCLSDFFFYFFLSSELCG